MHRFLFQSWLDYNPLLPARGKLSTPLNSSHHTGQENVWFVECSTTARATPASGESVTLSQVQNSETLRDSWDLMVLLQTFAGPRHPLRANLMYEQPLRAFQNIGIGLRVKASLEILGIGIGVKKIGIAQV